MRRALLHAALLTVALLASPAALAQSFPTRPVTVLVGVAAGGGVDASTRVFAEAISKTIGQRMVVENRVGGGGVVASMAVKQARPDGYTLLIANSGTHAILGSLQNLPYNGMTDFTPITLLFYMIGILTVPVDSPANTVADLVSLARATPGGLTYGSQGMGSGGHIYGAAFQLATQAPLVHVPYTGGAVMNLDLVAGRLDMAFGAYNSMSEYWKEKKVKFLALTSDERSPYVPDLPTMAEAGYSGINFDTWYGLAAPAGTPPTIVKKLHDEFVRASRDPEVVKKMAVLGIGIRTSTPKEFADLIASDTRRFSKIIAEAGIRSN